LRQERCTVVLILTVSKIEPMENSDTKIQVKCPQCGRLTIYSKENSSRPFCSDRCKLLDLGAWASEKFKVPTNEHADFAHPDKESDDEVDTES
jgi:uncharacterized protein